MKRLFSLALAVALACALVAVSALPVMAAEGESVWVELLETATVNDSGNNLVTTSSTSTIFSIDTPQYMRCTNVDMLLTHPAGSAPTSVRVQYGSTYYSLTMVKINSTTTRVYGANIPDSLYANMVFQLNKSGTSTVTYQILSCKVCLLSSTIMSATAHAELSGTNYDTPFAVTIPGVTDGKDVFEHFQFPIIVTDWQKYDSIVISGSMSYLALNSVRCAIGGLGLPYEISYALSNPSGSSGNASTWNEMKYYTYDESYKGTSETEFFTYDEYLGKTLFTVTIDISGVDRSNTNNLYCYFTCLANEYYGYSVQILDVIGMVEIADTSEMSWWDRFTSFMSDLFGRDDPEADEFGSTMESQAGELQDAVDEMDQVEKPDVEDLDVSLDAYFDDDAMSSVNGVLSSIFSNEIIVTMLIITLTCAFASYALFGKR